ncbi:9621_t:CDS:2, partial [Cetraspora pellucida]
MNGTAEQRQLILTGEVIHQKALEFAALLGVPESDFKASDTESVLIEFLPQFREELKDLLKLYEPRDIFNADKCNGTEKIKPLVINKSRMLLAFYHEGITSHNQLSVDYYHNEKAWMCQDIFK